MKLARALCPTCKNVGKIEDKTFESVWQIMTEVGIQERHFNDPQSKYRTMASTWLFATFSAIGVVISAAIQINIVSCTQQTEVSKMLAYDEKKLQADYKYLAPDGSEIRLLVDVTKGGLAHCTLPPGKISTAVRHKTVEEIWYFIEGKGEVWRKQDDLGKVIEVGPGMSLTIPLGTHFQFRNIGEVPLKFLICTMPPWPGKDEAVKVEGYWKDPQ